MGSTANYNLECRGFNNLGIVVFIDYWSWLVRWEWCSLFIVGVISGICGLKFIRQFSIVQNLRSPVIYYIFPYQKGVSYLPQPAPPPDSKQSLSFALYRLLESTFAEQHLA